MIARMNAGSALMRMSTRTEDCATPARKDPYTTLLTYGAASCLVVVLLTCAGNGMMRLAIILGAILAYGIVRTRRIYPFARILAPAPEPILERERDSRGSRLESHKSSTGGVMLLWLVFLLGLSVLSTRVSMVYVPYLSQPDLIGKITNVPAIAAPVSSYLPPGQRATAIQWLTAALRVFDTLVLFSLSLFFSITGSACLYWFSIYRMDRKSQRIAA